MILFELQVFPSILDCLLIASHISVVADSLRTILVALNQGHLFVSEPHIRRTCAGVAAPLSKPLVTDATRGVSVTTGTHEVCPPVLIMSVNIM